MILDCHWLQALQGLMELVTPTLKEVAAVDLFWFVWRGAGMP